MKNKHTILLKNSGQAVVESVLIISLLLIVFTSAIKIFKQEDILKKLIAKPWDRIDSVIKNGDISKNPIHPNSLTRHASLKK